MTPAEAGTEMTASKVAEARKRTAMIESFRTTAHHVFHIMFPASAQKGGRCHWRSLSSARHRKRGRREAPPFESMSLCWTRRQTRNENARLGHKPPPRSEKPEAGAFKPASGMANSQSRKPSL